MVSDRETQIQKTKANREDSYFPQLRPAPADVYPGEGASSSPSGGRSGGEFFRFAITVEMRGVALKVRAVTTPTTARSQTCWAACRVREESIDVKWELQVGVELQAVAVRIAHVELACAPAGLGDLGAIGNPPELLR